MRNYILSAVVGALLTSGVYQIVDNAPDSTQIAFGTRDDGRGSSRNSRGSDGYRFTRAQYEQTEGTYEIVLYDSYDALWAEADRRAEQYNAAVGNAGQPDAFSLLNPNTRRCEIHMVRPTVEYVPEIVGHEMMHCIFGQYHQHNNNRN